MCGLDDVKIFPSNPQPMMGQPDSVENSAQPVKIEPKGEFDDIIIQTNQQDDVIDTSSRDSLGEMPDADLKAQLDRLTEQSAEQAFRSVGKEELAEALKHSRLNCIVRFKNKKVSWAYAMQIYNALPTQGKGTVDFDGVKLTAADKNALYSAIRHGEINEDAENKDLMTKQETAAKAMKNLAFIGTEHKNFADPDSMESGIVDEAIRAQLELGDLLMERINASPVEDTSDLEEMQRRCMMRASELNQLKNEMIRLATSDYYKTGAPVAVQEEEEDPNVISTSVKPKQDAVQNENTVLLQGGKDNSALSQKTFVSMLSGMASQMHGMDVLGNLQGEMSGMLQQLAALQKGEPDEKALMKINQFEASINHTRQTLAQIRKNGLQIGQGAGIMRLDEALLDAMDKLLDEGLKRVRDIGKGVFSIAMKKVIQAEIPKIPLTELDGHEELLQNSGLDTLIAAHTKLKALREALTEMSENYQGTASLEKLKNAVRELRDLTMSQDFYTDFEQQYFSSWDGLRRKVQDEINRNPNDESLQTLMVKLDRICSRNGGDGFQLSPFNLLAGQCQKLDYIVNHIVMMGENYDSRIKADERESKRMYDAVFYGKLPIETAVEARIHNVDLDDIALGTSDAERTEISKLGEGGSNSVYRCQYANGKTYVYKPEIIGRCALNHMVYVSGTETFQSQQTILNLNVASVKCAKLLGTEKRLVETKGGVVNGRFGILMGVAKGKGNDEWHTRLGRLEMKRQVNKAPGGKKAIYGQMMHKLNQLHWLDLLTGQIDRHWNNYKIDIADDGAVEIQGIDNDCCFGDIMVGVNTYEMSAARMRQLTRMIMDGVTQVYRNTADARAAMKTIKEQILDKLPPGSKPGSVILDMNQCKNIFVVNAMRTTVGVQSHALPDKISKETYDHLMELKAHPELLEEALQGRIPPKALQNTKARLQQLCDHAEHLKNTGNLIDNDADWESTAMAQKSMNYSDKNAFRQLLANQGLPDASLNSRFYSAYLIATSQNYFQRDYLDLCENALK